jgi:flagellar motor switch protein FliM
MKTEVFVSGSLVNPEFARSMKPKAFDWTRPDMFSRDQIRALSLIHERFAMGLAGSYPEAMAACHVRRVDQESFGECKASIGGDAVCAMACADAQGPAAEAAHEGRRYFTQSRSAEVRFDEAAAERIAREAAALEAASPFSVILFFASPGGAFAPLLSDGGAFTDRVLPLLRDAWKQRVRMPALVGKPSGEAGGTAAIPDRAMILLVEFQLGNTAEKMTMVYPSDHLRKILSFLS